MKRIGPSHRPLVPLAPVIPSVASIRRRDLLAWGSLAALAPFTPWLNRAAAATARPQAFDGADAAGATGASGERVPAARSVPALALSAGYLEGSQEISNLRKLPADLRLLTVVRRGSTFQSGRNMLPADAMPSGDPSLVGGAVRMTIHDLYPSLLPQDHENADRWPLAVDLDVHVPVTDAPAGTTALFQPWSYRRLAGQVIAEDRSARISFVFWPDFYTDFVVTLRVVPAASSAGAAGAQPQIFSAAFALGAGDNRPKLLKGAYLLGLRQGIWNEPFELPEDPAQVPPERLSVLMTVEPEGLRIGRR